MQFSPNGMSRLKIREGVRYKAYKDSKGLWTIGVGHLLDQSVDQSNLVWNDSQVNKAFIHDIQWAVDAVNGVQTPLNQNMFDALVSFVFNIGARAFANSTMKKLLDKGLYVDAAREFDKWVIPAEITSRRMSEKAQFLNPV